MEKIIFLTYTLKTGGAENALIQLVNHLSDRGKNIVLVALVDGDYSACLNEKITYKYIFKAEQNKYKALLRYKILVQLIKWIPNACAKYVDFLLGNVENAKVISFLEGPTTKLLASMSARKKIAWMHTDYLTNRWASDFFRGKKDEFRCYSNMDQVVFVSNKGRESFFEYFGCSESVIPNCVIPNIIPKQDILDKAKEKIDSNIAHAYHDGVPVIVSVGRIEKVKKVQTQILALDQLHSGGVKANLVIVGSGSQLDSLRKMVLSKNIQGVFFTGYQKNPYPYVAAADIFVSTSIAESYPMNIAEAMVLGKPILTTRNIGAVEITENGRFALLSDYEIENFYHLLDKLIRSNSFRNTITCKSREGAKTFDENAVVDRVLEILNS